MKEEEKYQPDEQVIMMTALGISPLYSDHSIKAEDVATILLAFGEDEFRKIMERMAMKVKEVYTMKELLAILSYCIKVMEISYSPRRIQNNFFFVPDQN